MIYTDRSRYVKGLQFCPRARWHEYSAFGSGFRPKGQDIFLSTGSALHKGLEGLLRRTMEARAAIVPDYFPERDVARSFILVALREYRDSITASGLTGAVPEEYLNQSSVIVEEQACLVEGLYWCFYRALLPWLLENFEILAVEQEEIAVAECDCIVRNLSLPAEDATAAAMEHEAAGCNGVVIMSRPDFIAVSKQSQEITLFDFKSTGYELDSREHEHMLQVIFGSLGVERRYSKPCTSHYFIGLHKGTRKSYGEDPVKRQQSPLCYGYLRASAGVLDAGDWKSSYQWEEGGRLRRVTKDYVKTPVWEAHFSDREEGISNVEHLVFSQPLEFAQQQVSYLGPSQREERMVPRLLAQVVAHEREWAERCAAVEGGSLSLDEAIPCSWDCYPYGRACAYQGICFENPGWEEPLGSPERWERRVPHHLPELERMEKSNVR